MYNEKPSELLEYLNKIRQSAAKHKYKLYFLSFLYNIIYESSETIENRFYKEKL